MTGGNPAPTVTGNQMPQKRDRKPSKIFVIAGKAAVKEYANLQAAEKDIQGNDFVVIRGQRLEKKVSVRFI